MEEAAGISLVGRRWELGDARATLDAALGGTGGLLLVTGEAGIGKTRLVEALTAGTTVRTLWGACWDDPGTPAFWPWTTVLRDCAAAVGLAPGADLAPVLGTTEGDRGPHPPATAAAIRQRRVVPVRGRGGRPAGDRARGPPLSPTRLLAEVGIIM